MSGFKAPDGKAILDQRTIEKGSEVFRKYALMQCGTFFGDGAQRGSDFTAETLRLSTVYMSDYYAARFREENGREASGMELKVIGESIRRELNFWRSYSSGVVYGEQMEFPKSVF